MSCIIKNKVGKLNYYYIVDVERVEGKVKHLNKLYIGNTNTLRATYEKCKANDKKNNNESE